MKLEQEIQNLEEQSMTYKSMGNKLSMITRTTSEEQQFRASECYRLSDYYRQLAEWLKKLKAYESDNEICKYCTHTDDADYCDICKHSTILVDYFDLEVNADDGNSN